MTSLKDLHDDLSDFFDGKGQDISRPVTIKHKGKKIRTQSKREVNQRTKNAFSAPNRDTLDPKLNVPLRNRDKGQALSPERMKRMKRSQRQAIILGRD